jgi:anaerobic selenocysteine-containing dehydrogenase
MPTSSCRPASGLTEDHVDTLFPSWAVRNVARWSPAVVERGADERADWEILLELAERLGGGPTGMRWMDRVLRYAKRLGLRWHPDRFVDLLLRTGPYGDRFIPGGRGLNLKKLREATHGIDLGPLEAGVTRRVLHRDRKVHLGAAPLLGAMDDLAQGLEPEVNGFDLLLIGRRDLRTNNSWMHNVPSLVAGRERCVLLVHPDDAARVGVADGALAMLESRVHRGPLRVQVSDEIRPGVVSLPHGWGHAPSAPWQRVAGARPGVSVNDWTDDQVVESVVGQSILNGVPVRLGPLSPEDQASARGVTWTQAPTAANVHSVGYTGVGRLPTASAAHVPDRELRAVAASPANRHEGRWYS